MKGKMYVSNDAFTGAREYICIETLENTVALMDTVNQYILWVTRNTLQYKYTEKMDDLLA